MDDRPSDGDAVLRINQNRGNQWFGSKKCLKLDFTSWSEETEEDHEIGLSEGSGERVGDIEAVVAVSRIEGGDVKRPRKGPSDVIAVSLVSVSVWISFRPTARQAATPLTLALGHVGTQMSSSVHMHA